MIRKLALMLLLTVVAVIGISGASAATSSISGFKFNDINGNGTWDPVEPALPNWTIVLTMPDGNKITNTTNASGFYIFSNLPAGNYTLEEVLQPGWVRTFPEEPIIKITLSEGEDINETGFGNMQVQVLQGTFNISGFKVNDTNGNGIRDSGEKGIENWSIRLLNATTGVQIASTSTNDSGFYQFTNLTTGIYNVTEEIRAGFTPTNATFREIIIENTDVTDVNFLNQVTVTLPPTPTPTPTPSPTPTLTPTPVPTPTLTPTPTTGSISGFKVDDLNSNGRWDTGENGLSGWTIQLKSIGKIKDIRKEIITNETGFYIFDNLPAGIYLIQEKHQKGFVPTGSPVKIVTLAQGENSINNNFTNRLVRILVRIDNQRNIEDNKGVDDQKEMEDDKDVDDQGNIEDNKDLGDEGNIEDNKDMDDQREMEDNKDLDDKENIEDDKDVDDHGNIKENKDKGNHGNIKENKDKGNHGNIKENEDKSNHGNTKDKKDLNHKNKKNKD